MAEHSDIQWTDATWNPTTGCTKISDGCKNCYIDRTPPFRMAGRKFVAGKIPLIMHADRLDKPLHWRKPKRIFVNSLSDLFHEDVPDEFIDRVFAVMALCPQHTFQVLTKRAERMQEYFAGIQEHDRDLQRWANSAAELFGEDAFTKVIERGSHNGCKNVHLGVSVENRKHGLPRIEHLRQTPAALRFLSVEPLLEDVGQIDLTGIGWVIVGGESGPGARPCNLDWLIDVVDQCNAAKIPVFVKQLGAHVIGWHNDRMEMMGETDHATGTDALVRWKLRDSKGGDIAEFPEDLRFRQFPACLGSGRKLK